MQGRNGSMQEKDDERKADAWICQIILEPYYNAAAQALKWFEEGSDGRPLGVTDPILSVLQRRWTQIKIIITEAFDNAINPHTKAESSLLSTRRIVL